MTLQPYKHSLYATWSYQAIHKTCFVCDYLFCLTESRGITCVDLKTQTAEPLPVQGLVMMCKISCHVQKKLGRTSSKTELHSFARPAGRSNAHGCPQRASVLLLYAVTYFFILNADSLEQLGHVIDPFNWLSQQLFAKLLGLRGLHTDSQQISLQARRGM